MKYLKSTPAEKVSSTVSAWAIYEKPTKNLSHEEILSNWQSIHHSYLSISNFFLPSHFLESVWNKYYIVLYYSGMLYNFYKTKNRYYIYKLDLKLMIEYSCFLSPLLLFMWSWFEDEGKWICINKNIMNPPYIGVSMCLPFSLFPNHHPETLTWLLGFTPSHLSLSNLQAT